MNMEIIYNMTNTKSVVRIEDDMFSAQDIVAIYLEPMKDTIFKVDIRGAQSCFRYSFGDKISRDIALETAKKNWRDALDYVL